MVQTLSHMLLLLYCWVTMCFDKADVRWMCVSNLKNRVYSQSCLWLWWASSARIWRMVENDLPGNHKLRNYAEACAFDACGSISQESEAWFGLCCLGSMRSSWCTFFWAGKFSCRERMGAVHRCCNSYNFNTVRRSGVHVVGKLSKGTSSVPSFKPLWC